MKDRSSSNLFRASLSLVLAAVVLGEEHAAMKTATIQRLRSFCINRQLNQY
jgi:hypothetical protein